MQPVYEILIPYNRTVASDDEYVLFSVVIFRRVHDEFVQKCRESKYVFSRTQSQTNTSEYDIIILGISSETSPTRKNF